VSEHAMKSEVHIMIKASGESQPCMFVTLHLCTFLEAYTDHKGA